MNISNVKEDLVLQHGKNVIFKSFTMLNSGSQSDPAGTFLLVVQCNALAVKQSVIVPTAALLIYEGTQCPGNGTILFCCM